MTLDASIAIIRIGIRLFLGVVLLSSGVSKFLHPGQFQQAIEDYEILPFDFDGRLPMLLSFCIPGLECMAGLGLISGLLLVPTVLLTMGLFAVFSGSLLVNLVRGRAELSCSCGGILGNHSISWWLVIRNVAFIVGLLILLV